MLAQEVLKQDPFSGHLFCFRGRRGHLVKILYWDGQGFCLFDKDAKTHDPPSAAQGSRQTTRTHDLTWQCRCMQAHPSRCAT